MLCHRFFAKGTARTSDVVDKRIIRYIMQHSKIRGGENVGSQAQVDHTFG
jgi:hypothetical protein